MSTDNNAPDPSAEPSAPPGEPVPRIKGVAMLEIVKGLRLHKGAALDVLPPALHGYLERRIAIGEWYPEADHLELQRAAVALFRPDDPDAWRWMGRQRATLDFHEIFIDHYVAGYVPGDLPATLRACETVWPIYRDTGRLVVSIGDSPPHRLRVVDYPLFDQDVVRLFSGYFERALELSGCGDVAIVEPTEWTGDRAEWRVGG